MIHLHVLNCMYICVCVCLCVRSVTIGSDVLLQLLSSANPVEMTCAVLRVCLSLAATDRLSRVEVLVCLFVCLSASFLVFIVCYSLSSVVFMQ